MVDAPAKFDVSIWRPTEGLRFVERHREVRAGLTMPGASGILMESYRVLQQAWVRLIGESWEQEWRDVPLEEESGT